MLGSIHIHFQSSDSNHDIYQIGVFDRIEGKLVVDRVPFCKGLVKDGMLYYEGGTKVSWRGHIVYNLSESRFVLTWPDRHDKNTIRELLQIIAPAPEYSRMFCYSDKEDSSIKYDVPINMIEDVTKGTDPIESRSTGEENL